jgi:hypothetical protein
LAPLLSLRDSVHRVCVRVAAHPGPRQIRRPDSTWRGSGWSRRPAPSSCGRFPSGGYSPPPRHTACHRALDSHPLSAATRGPGTSSWCSHTPTTSPCMSHSSLSSSTLFGARKVLDEIHVSSHSGRKLRRSCSNWNGDRENCGKDNDQCV